MFTATLIASLLAIASASAHTITLRNNCAFGVGMTLSNFPNTGVPYTGAPIPDIPAGGSFNLVVPKGWDGRICDRPPNSGCQNNCFGGIAFGEAACSMTEWNFDSSNINGNTDYDISNIQGFSVAQQIIAPDGNSVICTNVNCPCNEAYRPGDTSGTCGGTGPVDQATRVGPSGDYTVVYCP